MIIPFKDSRFSIQSKPRSLIILTGKLTFGFILYLSKEAGLPVKSKTRKKALKPQKETSPTILVPITEINIRVTNLNVCHFTIYPFQ